MMLAHRFAGGGDEDVVLLHSLALDGHVWDPLLARLGDRVRAVVLDLRGHGASPDSSDFTVEDMADDVVETMTTLGITDAVVVGMSLGGCVAQSVAIRHPDRVRALGLVDTTAWYGPDAVTAWAERAERARTGGLDSLAEFQLERWFSAGFLAEHPDVGADLLARFVANDIDSYVATCHAMGAFDARDQLGAVSVPTAVIVGEHDGATPVTHAEDIASRIEGATLTVIPAAKHLTPIERPDVVVDAIDELRSRSPG